MAHWLPTEFLFRTPKFTDSEFQYGVKMPKPSFARMILPGRKDTGHLQKTNGKYIMSKGSEVAFIKSEDATGGRERKGKGRKGGTKDLDSLLRVSDYRKTNWFLMIRWRWLLSPVDGMRRYGQRWLAQSYRPCCCRCCCCRRCSGCLWAEGIFEEHVN